MHPWQFTVLVLVLAVIGGVVWFVRRTIASRKR